MTALHRQSIMLVLAVFVSAIFLASLAKQTAGAAPGLNFPTPPPEPTNIAHTQRTPAGIPGATSATGASIGADDIRHYITSHNVPGNMGNAQFSVTSLTQMQVADLIKILGGASPGQSPDTMVWYVELSGQFVFPGSSKQPDGLRYPVAFEVFLASNGNLLMEGGRPQPASGGTPAPQPTSTPAGVPTATPAAGGTTPTPAPTATNVPPTATPTPTSTPKPTVCTLLSGGNAQLNVDIGYFDFDSGTQSIAPTASSDLHYRAASFSTFTAINGASIFDWGVGQPPCSQYLKVGYVPDGTASVKLNETYMERTNGGHIAVFTVTSFSPDIIAIQWNLYNVS